MRDTVRQIGPRVGALERERSVTAVFGYTHIPLCVLYIALLLLSQMGYFCHGTIPSQGSCVWPIFKVTEVFEKVQV